MPSGDGVDELQPAHPVAQRKKLPPHFQYFMFFM